MAIKLRSPSVFILGAGRPYRGSHPSALHHTPGNRRVLDWIMNAFTSVLPVEFHYIGGFHVEEVIQQYPHIQFSINPRWQDTGSTASLLIGLDAPDTTCFVCYSDIVFNAQIVRMLNETEGDLVLVADREWTTRYSSRTVEDLHIAEKVRFQENQVTAVAKDIPVGQADAEFIGLLKLSTHAVNHIWDRRGQYTTHLQKADIPGLITQLMEDGMDVRALVIEGGWSELNAPQDLARFVLGTKAESLERLRPLVRKGYIGDQVSFTVEAWQKEKESILQSIMDKFSGNAVIVRSSALSEDSWTQSNAGNYTSLLNISSSDGSEMAQAVETVIYSYGERHPGDQVLVQAMLQNVDISGVIFTRTLNFGAPYYVINYDDVTSNTASVTGGNGQHLKTLIAHRNVFDRDLPLDSRIAHLLMAVKEIEDLVGHNSLDIEFAVTTERQIHILQIRPITVSHSQSRVSDQDLDQVLKTAMSSYRTEQHPGPNLLGSRAVFGIMPDWNPAEVIGTKPRQLALSLYQHILTDDTWATQRAEHGYRDVRPCPLLKIFAGHPYIDVRASFNSFIPDTIPDDLAARLANYYLDQLVGNPQWHDKVEFNIVFTSLYFDFQQQAEARLLDNGFTHQDIDILRQGLLGVTQHAFERYQSDLNRVKILDQRYVRIGQSNMAPLQRVSHLLHDCRMFGTLPFAHLARDAFIAMSFLRSMERIDLIEQHQLTPFLNGLNTVTKQFKVDGVRTAHGEISWEDFVGRYGHLRPGTYDITSLAYAEDPDRYLRPTTESSASGDESLDVEYIWDDKLKEETARHLSKQGFKISIDAFIQFLKEVIAGREYAKFMFSRNISAAMDALIGFGHEYGIDRERLSYIPIQDFFRLQGGLPIRDIGTWLRKRAEAGTEEYDLTQAVELPPLISSEEHFWFFERFSSQPNFVSRKQITADVVELSDTSEGQESLDGKIILVPQADPGYDWIFAYKIAGLITTYGGANSHMTIRTAELNIPAAIGVGESLYEHLQQATIVDLNCITEQIRIIS